MKIKDSGIRTEFETGAVRDVQEDKGRMDLLPMRALMEVSKLLEAGAKKYGDRNWEKGIPLNRFLDSGLRHIAKFAIGMYDEPHLVQACWNFLCLLDTQLRIQDGILPTTLLNIPCTDVDDLIKYVKTLPENPVPKTPGKLGDKICDLTDKFKNPVSGRKIDDTDI